MEFGILGPLEVRDGGVAIQLAGVRQRSVLAVLLLNANEPVSTDRLVEELWEEKPPDSAVKTVQVYVSQLRKLLGAPAVVTSPSGYVLRVDADRIDADRFERLTAEGRRALAAGQAAAAANRLSDALSLWRGVPLADFTYESFAQAEIARLEELRMAAIEDRIEADLRCGRATKVIGELQALTVRHPLREALCGQLMLALYRSGRQAEALDVYRDTRARLVDELGIEPGRELQELERAVLIQDPSLGPSKPDHPKHLPEAVAPLEERRLVTVVVTQLVDPAPPPASRDREHARAVLAPYHALLGAEVERFGGTVEAHSARTLTAVFGAPRAHENDAERGVAAALRIQQLVSDLAQREENPAPAAKSGLATGEAIVNRESGSGEETGIEGGEIASMAARLVELGRPGDVVVDESTYRVTVDTIEYERQDALGREGSDKALPAWSARSVRRRVDGQSAPTRFVGRTHELTVLEDLNRVVIAERRPRLITVVGQAGVGKTRLVEELISRSQAGPSGPAVYTGRCLSYGEGITYWALREVLWAAAGILLGDGSAEAGKKLARLVRRLDVPDAERAIFALAIGAGLSLAGNPLEDTSPESIAEELGLAWPLFLSALAAERPTTIVLEDLHWAEPLLLDMIENIVSRSSGPLFVVATARPKFADARAAWSSTPQMSQVGLEPLSETQAQELVDGLLPGVDAELRDRVVSTAEGNPFFAEEIVRHLFDRGLLRGDRCEAAQAATVSVPSTVRAVLAARIDALSDAEKRAIRDAAVVGRTFWLTTLESIRPDVPIRQSLKTLEEKGLIVTRPVSSLGDQTELSFRHVLIREVAYASIPPGQRSRAHASVAAWLEQIAGDRRGEFIDLIAHHYEAAVDPEHADLAWPTASPERDELRTQAIEALLDAGAAARQRFETEQAVRYADRALQLTQGGRDRLSALGLKAGSLHDAVRSDEAFSIYLEAIELAREMGEAETAARLRAEATLLCAVYYGGFAGVDWLPTAIELVEEWLKESDEASVTFERGALLIGRASLASWNSFSGVDVEAARRELRRAMEIAEAIRAPELFAAAAVADSFHAIQDGLCQAAEAGDLLLRAGKKVSGRVEAHECLVRAAVSFYWGGRFEAALEVAERATAEAASLGSHRRLHAACAQTLCLLAAGRVAELLEATADVTALVRDEGFRTCPLAGMALAGQALSLFEAERVPEAVSAVELLRDTPKPRAVSFQYRAAEILRPFAGTDETRRELERIQGQPLDAADAASKLRVELQLGALSAESTELDRLIHNGRATANRACAPYLAWMADWAEAMRLARAGATDEAARRGQAAAAGLDAYGERYSAARLLVDLMPLLDPEATGTIAEETAERLEHMGAFASAVEARLAAAQ